MRNLLPRNEALANQDTLCAQDPIGGAGNAAPRIANEEICESASHERTGDSEDRVMRENRESQADAAENKRKEKAGVVLMLEFREDDSFHVLTLPARLRRPPSGAGRSKSHTSRRRRPRSSARCRWPPGR